MVHFFPPCFSYTIMKMCWNLEPTERPTFSKITQMIERLLGDQPEQEQVSESTAGLSDSSLPLQKKKNYTWNKACDEDVLRKPCFFPQLNSPEDTADLALLSNQFVIKSYLRAVANGFETKKRPLLHKQGTRNHVFDRKYCLNARIRRH